MWGPVCELTSELDGQAGAALKKEQEMLAKINDMQMAQLRAAIYLAKNPSTPHQNALAVLTAYYAERAGSGKAYFLHALPKAVDSIRRAAYLKGHLDEYLNLLEKSSGGNNKCLVTTDDATVATRGGDQKLAGKNCKLSLSPLKPVDAALTYITKAGVGKLRYDDGGAGGNAVTPSKSGVHACKLLIAHNTAGYGDGGGVTADIDVFAGYMKVKATDAEPKLAAKSDLEEGGGGGAEAWKALHTAIKQEADAEAAELTNETGKLGERRHFLAAATNVLGTGAAGTGNAGRAAVEAAFGSDSEGGDRKIIELIEKELIVKGTANRDADESLGNIKTLKELGELLSYFQLKNSNTINELRNKLKAVEKEQGVKPEEEKEKECNSAKDNEDKCKGLKDKGCVFNPKGTEGKKCTLSEEGKQAAKEAGQGNGATGTTANTTGNNSFTIKKPPLFLALLLF